MIFLVLPLFFRFFTAEAVIPEYLPVNEQVNLVVMMQSIIKLHLASARQKFLVFASMFTGSSSALDSWGESLKHEVARGEGNLPI